MSISTEPVLTTATLTALAVAGINLLTSFNVPMTADQSESIIALVQTSAPFLILAGGFIARRFVTPVSRCEEKVKKALEQEPPAAYTEDGEYIPRRLRVRDK